MCTVRSSLVFLAALTLAAPAFADPPASDAPLATAKGAPAAPTDTTSADIKSFLAEGADDKNSEPLPDHKPHGFVSVGAGTNGAREVAGAVALPVGDKATVDLAIDYSQFDGRKH